MINNFGFETKEWEKEGKEKEKRPEKLDKVYVCCQCMAVFLFRSDMQEHFVNSDHKEIVVIGMLALDETERKEGSRNNNKDTFFSRN